MRCLIIIGFFRYSFYMKSLIVIVLLVFSLVSAFAGDELPDAKTMRNQYPHRNYDAALVTELLNGIRVEIQNAAKSGDRVVDLALREKKDLKLIHGCILDRVQDALSKDLVQKGYRIKLAENLECALEISWLEDGEKLRSDVDDPNPDHKEPQIRILYFHQN